MNPFDSAGTDRTISLSCDQTPTVEGKCLHPDKIQRVNKIIKYLEENCAHDVHFDQLEQCVHLNRHYLARVFKEVTGQTIFQYLYQCRVRRAKKLMMMNGHKTLTEICYEVGFKQLSHFSIKFKQSTGLTPKRFRKMYP